jgi:AraC family transcriptional regulator
MARLVVKPTRARPIATGTCRSLKGCPVSTNHMARPLSPDQADGHTTTLLRTGMFRVDDACCRRCASSRRSGEEAKADYMVTFPRSGMNVRHTAGGTISVDPNTLVFANRHSPYQVSHPNGSGEDAMNLAVRADVLRDVLRDLDVAERDTDLFAFASGPCDPTMFVRHRRLLARVRGGAPLDDADADEALLTFLADVLRQQYALRDRRRSQRPIAARVQREIVAAVQQHLAAHLSASVGLDDIARHVGSSPYRLCRIFRTYTGQSIRAYRTQLRLRTAFDRLSNGADITDLALELGFSSHSHFSAVFRSAFGRAPSSLRARGAVDRAPNRAGF